MNPVIAKAVTSVLPSVVRSVLRRALSSASGAAKARLLALLTRAAALGHPTNASGNNRSQR